MSDDSYSAQSGKTSNGAGRKNKGDIYTNINPHNLQRLANKTAVVTGSTRGIGEGIARRFASEGANVVVSGRTVDAGEEIARDINHSGGEAIFIQADMSIPDDIKKLIGHTVENYEAIDILVNNAAAWRHGSFEERTTDDWDTVINVSLRAPWLATKYALEAMPPGGAVINISSIHALASDPGRFPYNVAKAGLNGMTRSMAIDLSSLDISVNAIMPGPIQNNQSVPTDYENRMARLMPANRIGKPNDVAGLAAYLASDEAGFVTGTSIPVDGGWTVCLFDDVDSYNESLK